MQPEERLRQVEATLVRMNYMLLSHQVILMGMLDGGNRDAVRKSIYAARDTMVKAASEDESGKPRKVIDRDLIEFLQKYIGSLVDPDPDVWTALTH